MSEPTRPDRSRVGGIEWLESTRGALTRSERHRLTAQILRGQAQGIVGRIGLALGRRPEQIEPIQAPPDSALARAAEDACRRLPTAIVGHSYRTWAYGRALAALDGDIGLDDELFYVAALLHDAGLIEAVTGEDFTLRSGHVAAACVAPHRGDDALRVRDAISAHATPGATVAADGAEAYYVQVGATVDLAGLGLQRLSADFVADVLADHPRQGLTAAITPLIRAEAEANPCGRFALLDRWGFALAIRLAPFPEK